MVAMASGSTPCFSIGSTSASFRPAPKISKNSSDATTNAAHGGIGTPSAPAWIMPKPSPFMAISTMTAGSMTKSPCAKLIVCEVCQTSVNPTSASA